ncbi:hypothetical protein G6L29_32050 [Agrobacterium rhizogenes]|uniref:hypothetical protein n=1 Tax=Rhizobium rhizogenes TaxID=359 RepID=UPI0015720C36|nr:hypothetical protein [Rhizobium rhizogenes]NTG91018.1 hypothetical protein [Rhizobium rhizogenes]NTI20291.1 hypothetical protein [Rhizobium rhizogenes]NTI39339.1 hypothetical protein [Rhizobium rhizogenes]WEO68942.1 hypothetical protein G6L54_022210 [Rhizobium rhizogenes]
MITIVIGGFFASIILPAWQGRYMKTKVLAARRLEIAESVTKNFQKYITAWKRLLAISDLEEISGLTKEQHQTKMGFVAARNASRDALLESLAVSNLYFPDACADVVESFCKWDEDRSTERLDKLPGISAWREWEAKVLRSLNQELMQ